MPIKTTCNSNCHMSGSSDKSFSSFQSAECWYKSCVAGIISELCLLCAQFSQNTAPLCISSKGGVENETVYQAILDPGAFVLFVLALFLFGKPAKQPDKYENYVAADTLSGKRVLPVYGVERTDGAIALTIDAAWGADKTPEILSILKERGITATFFLVGRWVREFPEQAKAIIEAGHLVGSHSDSHAHFCALTNEQIEQELKATEDALITAGAKKPTLFRPPYGEYDDRVVQKLRDLGYQVIQWSIDTLDWKEAAPRARCWKSYSGKRRPARSYYATTTRRASWNTSSCSTSLHPGAMNLLPLES